jgi:hypothetical protein
MRKESILRTKPTSLEARLSSDKQDNQTLPFSKYAFRIQVIRCLNIPLVQRFVVVQPRRSG